MRIKSKTFQLREDNEGLKERMAKIDAILAQVSIVSFSNFTFSIFTS